jgi:hypothetical protein
MDRFHNTVGVGEMIVSDTFGDILVAYAAGDFTGGRLDNYGTFALPTVFAAPAEREASEAVADVAREYARQPAA